MGQGRLMSIYDDLFGQFNQPVAQILLTRNDLADVSLFHTSVFVLFVHFISLLFFDSARNI